MTQIANLVHQTTIGTGTGDIVLSILTGRRTFFFSAFGAEPSSKFFYFINHRERAEWEAGIGYLLANNQLKRETVISSSNSNGLVDFSAGIKDVVNDIEASRQLILPSGLSSGDLLVYNGSSFNRLAKGSNGQVLYINNSSVEWSSAISNSLSALNESVNNLNESVNNVNEIINDLENSIESQISVLSNEISDIQTQLGSLSDIGISGLVLSNNTTDSNRDIDISMGQANSDDLTTTIKLETSITKQLDASWAVGTNQGGLDTGSIAANTWYHVWLIKRSDTGDVDVLFSTSATTPTMPTNYDLKRRIGAIKTNASSNIIAFRQYGDKFLWDRPIQDASSATISTIRSNVTLSVPNGIVTLPIFNIKSFPSTNVVRYILITNPDMTDTAPSASSYHFTTSASTTVSTEVFIENCLTNTTSQLSFRTNFLTVTYSIMTLGWIDPRGKW